MREDKCHWWRLFRGIILCCLSYTTLLLTKITHIHTQIGLPPPTLWSLSHLAGSSFTAERQNCALHPLSSLHSQCTHLFLLHPVEMGKGMAICGACPLGLHRKLLTDQEHCLLLHRMRVTREGFVIFPNILGTCVVVVSPPLPSHSTQSPAGPLSVMIRKHSLHIKETHSD